MTVDSVIFIAIAEIAGVFVGFGALISVTRRSDVDPAQLGSIRAVVTAGLTVVVAALIPVVSASYGVGGPAAVVRLQPHLPGAELGGHRPVPSRACEPSANGESRQDAASKQPVLLARP